MYFGWAFQIYGQKSLQISGFTVVILKIFRINGGWYYTLNGTTPYHRVPSYPSPGDKCLIQHTIIPLLYCWVICSLAAIHTGLLLFIAKFSYISLQVVEDGYQFFQQRKVSSNQSRFIGKECYIEPQLVQLW